MARSSVSPVLATALCCLSLAWVAPFVEAEVLLQEVYVPADKPAVWPTKGETYLPIEQERLRELLKSANRSIKASANPKIEQWVMVGSLAANDAIVGKGAVRIEAADSAGWLPLEMSGLSLQNCKWRETDKTVWFGVDPSTSQLAARIKQSDWIDFNWQTGVSSRTNRSQRYRMSLPNSVATCLALTLPENLIPEKIRGSSLVVTRIDGQQDLPFDAPALGWPAEPSPGTQRWLLRWPPGIVAQWHIRNAEQVAAITPPPEVSFDEKLNYVVNESGVATKQQVRLTPLSEQTDSIKIDVPSELVVQAIRYRGVPLDIENQSDGSTIIRLPNSTDQTNDNTTSVDEPSMLEIEAWSPWSTEGATELPRIDLPGLYWETGQIDVRLASRLKVEDLTLDAVVQLSPESSTNQQRLSFAKVDADGTVSLTVSEQSVTDRIRIGRSVQLGLAANTATCTTLFDRRWPAPVQVLIATLVKDWQPGRVSVDAPYAVDDWYVADQPDQRQLVIRLTKAPQPPSAPVEPIRVTVEATRPVSDDRGWAPIEDFDVLRWRRVSPVVSLMTFDVKDGYRLEMNPRPAALTEEELAETNASLLPEDLTGEVFDRFTLGGSVQGYLTPAASQLDAEITTIVMDQEEQWKVGHRLKCTPRSGTLGSLYIQLNDAGEAPPRWRLAGEKNWRVSQRDDSVRRNATWVLNLPRRQSEPFTVEIEPAVYPGLICTPAPAEVIGEGARRHWLELRSDQIRNLAVEAEGWEPQLRYRQGQQPLHSTWELTSPNEWDSRFVITRTETKPSLPLASILAADLETTVAPAVESRQRLKIRVQNRGETNFSCELPIGATDVRWRPVPTDNQVATSWFNANDFVCDIELIPSLAIQEFQVEFSLPIDFSHGATIRMPRIEFDLPVRARKWTIYYPDHYNITTPSSSISTPYAGWAKRLFGPLASGPIRMLVSSGGGSKSSTFQEKVVPIGVGDWTEVTFHHRAKSQAMLAALFAVASLVGYLLWNRTSTFFTVLVLAALFALLLPSPAFGTATAIWGGLLLAAALRSLLGVTHLRRELPMDTPNGSVAVKAMGAFAILALMASVCFAEQPASSESSTTIETILVPMDEQAQPVGNTRYVSSKLYAELLRREQQAATQQPWLVSNVRIEGVWPDDNSILPTSSQRNWQISFDLETKQAQTAVDLSLRLTDAIWDNNVRLDGVPVPASWNAAGDRLRFEVPRAGRFRARISFAPKFDSRRLQQLDLQVPAIPNSQLRLEMPGQANDLRVNGLPLKSAGTNGIYVIPLPVSNQLEISSAAKPDPQFELLQAEGWEWMTFSSGKFTLDCAYQYNAESELCEVPPLRIDGSIPSSPTNETSLEWKLSQPPSIEETADGNPLIRFQLTRNRSRIFGRFRLPKIQLENTNLTARHEAITHPSDLTVSMLGGRTVNSELLDQMKLIWSDREVPNSLATLTSSRRGLEVNIRPNVANNLIEETLEVTCSENQLLVDYRGAISVGRWLPYFQEFRVSPELKVDYVLLTVDDRTQAVPFSRPSEDKLLVRFTELPAANYKIKIQAKVTPAKSSKKKVKAWDVPVLTATTDSAARQRVTVYADDDLLVETEPGSSELVRTDSFAAPEKKQQSYAADQFSVLADRSEPLKVIVSPNKPKLVAAVLNTFEYQAGSCQAEIDLLLDLREGVLPSIVIDWPEPFSNLVEIESGYAVELVSAQSGARRGLRIRLPKALGPGERQRVTLRCKLEDTYDASEPLPIAYVREAQQSMAYVGLVKSDRGVWSWQGATETVAPASIEEILARWPQAKLLLATEAGRPTIRWSPNGAEKQITEIPLVRVSITPDDGQRIQVTTRWVIPAQSESSVTLKMVGDRMPASVRVDNQPANVTAGNGAYNVLLPDPKLPHVVELTTWADRSEIASGLEVAQLVIGKRTTIVNHLVWRIYLPGTQHVALDESSQSLAAVDLAALELSQLLSIGFGPATNSDDPLPQSWTMAWIGDLTRAIRRLEAAMTAQRISSDTVVAFDNTDEYAELLTRAKAELERLSDVSTETGAPPAIDGSFTELPGKAEIFVQSEPAPLRLAESSLPHSKDWTRWSLAMIFALVATVHLAIRYRGGEIKLPLGSEYSRLYFAAVLLGIVWWFSLWPRELGPVISLLAFVAWLRWRRISPQKTDA